MIIYLVLQLSAAENLEEMHVSSRLKHESHFLATQGKSSELQSCHEAYQVLVRVIRAKNTFIRKAAERRGKQNNTQIDVVKASQSWRKTNTLIN